MMQTKTKKQNSSAIKIQRRISPPENGVRKGMSGSGGEVSRLSFSVIRTQNNARRKRLQIRRLKYTCNINPRSVKETKEGRVEEERERLTEMSLSLSLSSSSDHSTENYGALSGFERKTCKEKDSFRTLSHGLVSIIGRRREMEDAVTAEVGFMVKYGSANHDHHGGGQKYDFFAVYDGHGGSQVAKACKERLHRVLVEIIADEYGKEGNDDDSKKNIVWESVMEDCFKKMDEEVNTGTLREEMVGSTAVVAVVGRDELVVANCGDSRAVLSRSGGVVLLSMDHKPDRPDELKRVEDAGGRVIKWNGHRVLGVLATSRSIGDQCLKPFVISKPEVMVIDRTDSDEFLILASDGLWDVVSNEVACQVVRRCFTGQIKWANSIEVGHQNAAARAAAVLAELAMARGSSDNISVIVVELNKPTKFH